MPMHMTMRWRDEAEARRADIAQQARRSRARCQPVSAMKWPDRRHERLVPRADHLALAQLLAIDFPARRVRQSVNGNKQRWDHVLW